MIAYKGFRPGMICIDYQFQMGLNVTDKANCRQNGFHCAENPLDCLNYYGDIDHSEYYIVNAGGDIDLDAALEELRSRSMQVPGGTCGFWGCCGAAVSAGQYYSIISGSTPMTQDPWAATARLTSNIIGRLADVGGPRCCKRTGFAAIEEAARYTAETTGIAMELPERTTCTFMANNAECRKRDCPFFPA